MNAIEINNLVKRYNGGMVALNNVSLTVKKGDFFGLLGLNGAGKTSLINILVGLVRPTEGNVHLMGHDLKTETVAAKRCIGVVPQEININPFLTVRKVMFFHGGYYGLPAGDIQKRYQEILKEVGLLHKEQSPVHTLSGGMKRRLLLARALLLNPDVLILDEPTAGVDVELRQEIWALLQKRNRQGMTILLTSHYMEEVEALCQHLAVLHHGKIIDSGHKSALLAKAQARQLVFHFSQEIESLPLLEGFIVEKKDPRSFLIKIGATSNLAQYLQIIEKEGHSVVDISNPTSRLEHYFRSQTEGTL